MAMLDPAMAAFDAEMRDKAGARPRGASTRRSVASDNMTSAGPAGEIDLGDSPAWAAFHNLRILQTIAHLRLHHLAKCTSSRF
jgi:hypothetical protein